MGKALGENVLADPRHALWIGDVEASLREGLRSTGWLLGEMAPRLSTEAELARSRSMVGVIDLRNTSEIDLKALEALLGAHPEKRWIALVCTQALANPRITALVRAGCFDYVTAPVDVERLAAALGHAWGMAKLDSVGSQTRTQDDFGDMLGDSAPMRELRTRIEKFAPADVPVLITGETGTGKEVAARAVHQRSSRREQPFVAINCGALPANLVQSELFGHERGAFTGANARKIGRIETADGGTVFLDEIGDLPLDAQTNLLRFLQEGTIERVGSCTSLRLDVRVIAATHVDLEKAVANGRFREDLYYRLNVLRLPVPPLRERGQDILRLARHFLATFRREHAAGTHVRDFGPEAEAALCAFPWPGNVRELMNRVRRAAVVAESSLISAADLDFSERIRAAARAPSATSTLDRARAHAEREAIVACLRASRFNVSECARRLQVSRVTIYRLCKKYSVTLDAPSPPN
jgi:two-component system, NtrC family, response regulator HydG